MDFSFAIKAKVLFADLQPEQSRVLPKRRSLWGYWVSVAALRLPDGQLLVIITSDSPQTAIADYAPCDGKLKPFLVV